ncbi:MIZ zinc finger domain protein [Aspergillus novofumigatus IBT 16806]|uniref:MIZ zinc finger protein n=1 Tax=Aspergillus novofumigatus (strain IBT 16806) TaxID=1392255 RepID=A0A2I1CKV7_ASPN1|nr:MIZ zinc finger protein [Aspergillus novofumigatus IBT 16806]PKX98255.1 MIZ zinc finger protein [Aspergillus novofumigatus IBT 16806]
MSPSTTKNRPHLPNNPHHQLEWSNSTANLFLGGVGVRRSWMLGASTSLSISSASAAAPAPAAAAATVPPDSSSQSSLAVVSAPSSASASAVANRPKSRPQGMQNSPSSSVTIVPQSQSKRDNNDVAFTANGNIIYAPATSLPSVLMSPVTPGRILPQNREIPPPCPGLPPSPRVFTTTPTTNFSSTPLTTESTAFVHATQPLQQSQSSSLPSPDPSSASHPSPASAGDRNDRSLSYGVLPSPPPVSGPMQIHGQLENPRQIGYRNLMPANASPATAGGERMAEETSAPPTIRGRQRHQQFRPSMTSAPPDSNHVPPSPVGPGPSTSFINQTFWTQSQETLDAFVARAEGAMLLSETVELPRIRLLRDACLEKDLFYLTLHQIYTLRTFAPSEFARLPYVSGQNETGMEVVQQLLVDNHRLSGDFLRWSVNFPRPLGVMCQTREFPIVLHQIARSLGFFSEKWTAFDRHVRERGYPPLIDELVVQFGITSTVLLSIVFLALSRRIFGTQHEDQLRSIYSKNKRNYVKRFGSRHTPQQIHRENERLIQAYKALSGTQTTPVGQHTSPAAREHAAQPLPQRSMQSVGPTGQITYVAAPSPQMPSAQVPVHSSQPQTQPIPVHAPGAMNRAAPMLLNGQRPQHPLPTRPNVVHASGLDTSSQVPAGQMTGMAALSPVPAPAPAPAGHQARILSHPPSQNVRQIPPQPSPHAMPITTPIHRFSAQTRQAQGLVQQPQQSPPIPQPLLPPPGPLPSTTTRPHPLRLALHQAHLRDPIIKWTSSGAGGEKTDKETNLFHYLRSFAVPPTPLGQTESAFEWQFPLSRADFDRLPRIVPRDTGQRLVRSLVDGSQIYRLRCIRISPSVNEVSQHTWCLTESVWPSVIYIFVNGVELYVRRKFHNGKDIPLDISGHLKEGFNTISLHFIRSAAESRDVVYALAVEVMDILSFTQVKKLAQTLPALQARERIRRRLSSSTADDELSIVSDYLSVNLVDPFMARIFDIPARGMTCEHVECFDLETYILTRASKAGKAVLKENWKCPICGADARPQHLIIDGFLGEVRADLVRMGCLEGARAIKIKADGSWELKSDGEGTSSQKELTRVQESSSLKRKREGVVSPLATQRPKTEGAGRESLASRESSASLIIELD